MIFLDRIKTITDPLNQTESYFYEEDYRVEYGLLESKTDRNGNRIKYKYDDLGRITRMTVTTPEGEIEESDYTYTLTGAKKGESNTNISTTYKYDELGRMIQENESGGIVKNYLYDIGNNRKSFNVLNNGNSIHNIRYEYNNMSSLKYVYDNNVLQATYTYNINGAQEKLEYANGNSEHYNYNLANWLTRLENRNASNSVISSYDYTYYADGNQKTKTDHNGRVSTYVYDDVGRLKNESEGTGLSISYNYDRFSNRELMRVIGPENYTVSYDYDNNNRLEKDNKTEGDETTTTNYYYDCNGNQTSKMTEKLFPAGDNQASVSIDPTGAEFYEYNGLNRLTRAFVDGKEVTYTYRTDGLRSSKTTSEGTVTHVWDGQNIVTDLKDGTVDTRYIRGINLIKSDNSSNGQKYYLYNGHGDVVQLVGNNEDIIWNYDYDAFGNERQIAGQDVSLDNNPFRYSGEYFDKETGTIYLRARNYDPEIGRMLSEDSYFNATNMINGNTESPNINAIAQSGNLYVYSMNNPLMYNDPSGNYSTTVSKKLTGAFAAASLVVAKMYSDSVKTINKIGSATDSLVNSVKEKIYNTKEKKSSGSGKTETGTSSKTVKPMSSKDSNSGSNTVDLPNQGTVNGNVEGAPPVDAGQQGKHVPGHNNYNPTKSKWPQGSNGIDLTQEAWQKGTVVKPDGSVKVYDFGKPVGSNGETRVKVHRDSGGNIHGYPIN